MIFKIGLVKNYFPKTEFAAVKLTSDISSIDKLIFTDLNEDRFGQMNNILRIEENIVTYAVSGKIVLIKVKKPIMKNSFVYKDA